MAERLVILAASGLPGAFDRLRARHTAAALLPPRLLVLSGGEAELDALRADPAVEAVLAPGDTALPASLSPEERLFAEAWLARQGMAGKTRPGEGLPWDAPGRLPPDPPRGR